MKRGNGEKIEIKQKKIKLEGQPKRAQSAFFIWMNANRDQIKKESPSNNAPDMAKTAGELWKTMSKSVSLHLYIHNNERLSYVWFMSFGQSVE